MKRTAIIGLLTSLAFAATANAQTPAPPDRSGPPALGAARTLTLPPVTKRALSNGLPVWIVESHEVPVASVALVIKSGGSADPAGKFGLASLTAAMLDEGAGSRDALALADAVDFLGATIGSGAGFDASTVSLYTPVSRLGAALDLMADVATKPTFAANELERLRKERLTSLMQIRDNPPAIGAAAFPRLIYGDAHRYGTGLAGTSETVAALTGADLRAFHAAHYQPRNAQLIVVGDVQPEAVMAALEKSFGGWKPAATAAANAPADFTAPKAGARTVYLIDKPGAAQSIIRIGWAGVPRSTPDFFALQVLNTILGGSFTSRLNTNLRETHGYAYGAGSSFDMRLGPGPFVAAANVQTDKTAESLTEFFNELTGIGTVPAEELEKAKSYVALGFPQEFETTRDIAAKLTEQVTYGLPDGWFDGYVAKIQAVTPTDISRAAKTYITPGTFAVVVVGDLKAIEAKVRALNLGVVHVVPIDDVLK